MNHDKFLKLIGEIDEEIIEKAIIRYQNKPSFIIPAIKRMGLLLKKQRRFLTAGAVIMIAVLLGGNLFSMSHYHWNELYHSDQVSVRYIKQLPEKISLSNESLLYNYTETELFERADYVFEGRVRKIDLIQVSFQDVKEYRTLITFQSLNLIKGTYKKSEIVIMSPVHLKKNVWVEDSELLSKLKVGTEGIFLVKGVSTQSIWEENNASLSLSEICDGIFEDGVRIGMLRKGKMVLYDESVFSSLQSDYWVAAKEYARKMVRNQ